MKKYVILIITINCLINNVAFGQLLQKESKDLVRGAEELKSGNYKDVLTSFFQLAVQDITSDNKSFEFKTSLFGIKLRADSTLLMDTNFVKQTFARNFQFILKINTDDKYKIKGFTGGFTYAICNKRDRKLADFRDTEFSEPINNYIDSLSALQREFNGFLIKNMHDTVVGPIMNQVSIGMDHFLSSANTDSFPDIFIKFLKERTNDDSNSSSGIIKNIISKEAFAKADSIIKVAYASIDKKLLWTASLNSSTSDFSVFDNASFETIVLQGAAGDAMEIDIRGNANYKDTIGFENDYRIDYGIKAGLNFNLLKNKKNGSHLLEVKPHFEYNRIYKGWLQSQEKETYLVNADIRIRITEDLWLPITIKYDLLENNVFGFLNISWNLDVFKNFLK